MAVVLVTGAGGPAGVAVIQALQAAGHRTVGVDVSPDAAGIRLADEGTVIPQAGNPYLHTAITTIIDRYDVSTLISTIPAEMSALDKLDIPHWFPSLSARSLCTDKWLFYQALLAADIPTPCSSSCVDNSVPGPWILKPRSGSGSKGIRTTGSSWTIGALWNTGDILQTQIAGREFTADCLVARDGTVVACVPRWRIATRGGISTIGETFESDDVTAMCSRVLQTIRLTGVANVQGFVNRDGVTIIECNPRFSGGLPLTVESGANIPAEYVRMIHDSDYMPTIVYRSGVKMSRYFSAVYEN